MDHQHEKFYVTTPIYYVTAKPHVGSLYTTVIADTVARWQRLQGKNVFFLTGTDEHGQKVAQAAADAGKSPKTFVDDVSAAYKAMWQHYNLSYTEFIRTTDENHKKGVYAWIAKAQEKGDIYKSYYEGWYCQPDEAFVADKASIPSNEPPLCPLCGRTTISASEESYFFRLSAYQDRLLEFYKHNPDFITPKERLNEVISFVEAGLKDLSISRTSVTWGIPFPGDPQHVIYVWIDALMNYLTAIGYGDPEKTANVNQWWPADLHCMGKEIVRFHAAYWPAFLMAADMPLPKKLLVHGWITVDGEKMSKSRNNVVDPTLLAEQYSVEPVKYYLLRKIPVTHDGDFSYHSLESVINSDLVGGLGNLLNRMLLLAEKHGIQTVTLPTAWSLESAALRTTANETLQLYITSMETYQFHIALTQLWTFVNSVNAYFHAHEPWRLATTDKHKFIEVVSATCHSLRTIGILLSPIMPQKMAILLQSIGVSLDHTKPHFGHNITAWDSFFTLTKTAPLFAKIEQKKDTSCTAEPAATPNTTLLKAQIAAPTIESVSIDIANQLALVVGTITKAELVAKSEKLLALQVDFGHRGTRSVLAGIRAWYKPDELVGKQAVFLYNLKPRSILGLTSEGMLMCAEREDGSVTFVTPAVSVPNGSRLR